MTPPAQRIEEFLGVWVALPHNGNEICQIHHGPPQELTVSDIYAVLSENKALRAENKRFRAALTKIDELEDRCNEASSEQALIAMQALKELQP